MTRRKAKATEEELKEVAGYQLFRLSETSRAEIYKQGRIISIIKDRDEELYVVGPR